MIDLDQLEARAKAATPGPWMSDGLSNVRCTFDDHRCVVLISPTFMGKTPTPEDADFIAAANPAVVLELIAEIRKLRMGTRSSAKGHPCDNCEVHCEYEGEPMTSCMLETLAYPGRW